MKSRANTGKPDIGTIQVPYDRFTCLFTQEQLDKLAIVKARTNRKPQISANHSDVFDRLLLDINQYHGGNE